MKNLKFKTKISLVSKINAYLKKAANPYYGDNYKPDRRIKPSDLGSSCMRKIYYSYLRTEVDQKITPDQKRIFDTGDAFHDMMKEWTKGADCLIEYRDPKTGQIPIGKYSKKPDSEFPISVEELYIKKGKIDAILELDGKLWIGEFKSSKEEKYGDLTDATDEHKMQANTYVHLFEYCWQRGDYDHIPELKKYTEISGVVFVYANKNDSDLKEFIVEKTEAALDEIVKKVMDIKAYVERKELPPGTEHYCFFCNWKTKCKRNFNPLT